MTTAAREKAERCFAVARSTSFEGERDAAISRGTAICERAGLSLDLFDIPGRVKAKRPKISGSQLAAEIDAKLMERMRRDLANAETRQNFAKAINPDDIFYEMAKFAAMRSRMGAYRRANDARSRFPTGLEAARHLIAQGILVFNSAGPGDAAKWRVQDIAEALTDDQLRDFALSHS